MAARSEAVLVHFYRAVVAHADVWRQRMDQTTNWAVVTTAAMISFTFSTPVAPHFVLLLALVFDGMFLLMESRRYQTYDLWRRRFRTLNQYMIAPALSATEVPDEEAVDEQLARVAADLGRTVPHLELSHAVGYRVRRNYGYLFTISLFAWVVKLEMHPLPARSVEEFLRRADVGFIPGPVILLGIAAAAAGMALLAVRAPTEQMLGWAEIPSPWSQWFRPQWWRGARRLLRSGSRRRR